MIQERGTDRRDEGGYIVRLPGKNDAIGDTLRGAFNPDMSVPRDIAVALHRLEKVPQ